MSIYRFLILLVFCGLLLFAVVGSAGCSCGDDDDDDDNDDSDDDDDDDDDDDSGDDDDNDTASGPTIDDTVPGDGDIELKLATVVEITFSEAMDQDSVEAAFSMDNGSKAAVPGTFSWTGGDTVLTFTPDSDLDENTLYTVSITTTAQSVAGDSLPNPFAMDFTSVDLWIYTHDGGDSGYEDGNAITVGPDGHYYAIGTLDLSANDDIWIQEFDLHGTELDTEIIDGTENDNDKGYGIALDGSGNLYAAGITSVSGEAANIWVRKFDSSWTSQWTDTYNGSANASDFGYGIAVDGSGNVYAVGAEYDTVQSSNIWLRKYNESGVPQWTEIHDGPASGGDWGKAVALDEANSALYVVGAEVTSGEDNNIWVRKYDLDGNDIWTEVYNGADNANDSGYGIAVDSVGNVYASGDTKVTGEKDNLWLRKYDSNGTILWTEIYDLANEIDRGKAVTVDFEDNVIVAGWEQPAGKAIPYDALVRKYDADGNLLWSWSYDGSGGDYDAFEGVCTDSYGNIIAIGFQYVSGHSDILIVKLDPDGNAAD